MCRRDTHTHGLDKVMATTPKILSVDDSKTVRRMLARLFRPFDCTLCEAANGEEGLAVAALEKPDLILLDYNMPVMDGITMLQRLREDAAFRHTPVIMLTAEAGAKNIAAAARLGARDYITKPFQDELLLAKAARIISLVPRPAHQSATDQPLMP
jgi:two-component system, cell cycle response regulator